MQLPQRFSATVHFTFLTHSGYKHLYQDKKESNARLLLIKENNETKRREEGTTEHPLRKNVRVLRSASRLKKSTQITHIPNLFPSRTNNELQSSLLSTLATNTSGTNDMTH
jgi:hypothetical protein